MNNYSEGEKKGSSRVFRGCFIVAASVALICFLGLVAVTGFFIAGTAMQLGRPSDPESIRMREIHLSGPPGAPKLAVINLEGLIYGSLSPSTRLSPVAILSAKLDRAHLDPEVKGVLLFIDSPGGDITGSDILHQRLQSFREESGGKPVVASILNLATSGAYYAICGVDKVMAHPTSITGSIGVLMPLYDATGLMQKIGIREDSILSGEHKNLGSPFAERPEDVKERQREILRNIVDVMHERFVQTVADSRQGLEAEDVERIADGRVITAFEALEAGLIDAVGYEPDAIAALAEMTGVPEPRLVQYRREVSLGAVFASFLAGRNTWTDVLPFIDVEPRQFHPRPMYYWVGEELN